MWIVTISGIPDRHVNINPASRAQIVASPASRGTIESRIPSIYPSFSRFPHRILVKSRIPKIPFQTLILWFVCPLSCATYHWIVWLLERASRSDTRRMTTVEKTSCVGVCMSYICSAGSNVAELELRRPKALELQCPSDNSCLLILHYHNCLTLLSLQLHVTFRAGVFYRV